MEIAVNSGFRPGEDIHLLWLLKTRLEDLEANIRHHLKKKREHESSGEHALAHAREVTADKEARAHWELSNILMTLTVGSSCSKILVKGGTFVDVPSWYCVRCGHLDPEEVTHDERCIKCDGALPI